MQDILALRHDRRVIAAVLIALLTAVVVVVAVALATGTLDAELIRGRIAGYRWTGPQVIVGGFGL